MVARNKHHYVKRTGTLICEYIAQGKSLTQALDAVGYLAPTVKSFWKWTVDFPEFREEYERALQFAGDMHADRMLELVDTVLTNPKKASAGKVAADILKWQAEIRNALKYGRKAAVKVKEPMDPAKIKKEIDRLQKELGVQEAKVKPFKAVG